MSVGYWLFFFDDTGDGLPQPFELPRAVPTVARGGVAEESPTLTLSVPPAVVQQPALHVDAPPPPPPTAPLRMSGEAAPATTITVSHDAQKSAPPPQVHPSFSSPPKPLENISFTVRLEEEK